MTKPYSKDWSQFGNHGPYIGQCCDNCLSFWNDTETEGCLLGKPLWDGLYLVEDDYEYYLNNKCPDWVAAYIKGKKIATLF